MSQLNKPKKTLYVLLIFTVICVGITTACIYNTLQIKENEKYGQVENQQTQNLLNKPSNPIKNVEPIGLTEKYTTNGIIIETIDVTDGDLIYEYEHAGNAIYEYDISYEQISGLKNVTIQNKINKEIEDTTLALKSKLTENPDYNHITITSTIRGNFSDVISVNLHYTLTKHDYSHQDSDYEYKYDFVGLNYRLDTGEKLEFADLFMDNTSIKSIVGQAAYETLAWEHSFEDDEVNEFGDPDFDSTDYGYIENQVFKIVSSYNKDPNINFYFTERNIIAKIKNHDIDIQLEDFVENIAIYTAFRANNLYADNSIQKEFYPFVHTFFIESIVDTGFKGDNFYYEILTYIEETEKNKDASASVRNTIYEKVEYYYELAKQNPEKAYMFSIIYIINDNPNDSKIGYYYCGEISETDAEYFQENAQNIIADAQREERVEVWCVDYSYYDENIEFYERVSKNLEDYQIDNEEEEIYTKADREAEEMEFAGV